MPTFDYRFQDLASKLEFDSRKHFYHLSKHRLFTCQCYALLPLSLPSEEDTSFFLSPLRTAAQSSKRMTHLREADNVARDDGLSTLHHLDLTSLKLFEDESFLNRYK